MRLARRAGTVNRQQRRQAARGAKRAHAGKSTATPRFREAVAHFEADRLDQAEAVCAGILAFSPRHLDALQMLGLIHHRRGNLEGALEALEKAVAAHPDAAALHNNVGEVLRALGRVEEALDHYRRALALDNTLSPSRVNAGLALMALDRPAEAEAEFRAVAPGGAGAAAARSNLAAALLAQGKLDEAEATARASLAADPDDPTANINLGAVLLDRGDPAGAATAFETAIARDPANVEAHYDLGGARRDEGDLDRAVASYRRAIAIRPGFTDALNNLGNCLRGQLKLEEARACLDEAVAGAPDNAEAHFNRALVALLAGDFVRGLEDYEGRWKLKASVPVRPFPCPAWDGGDLEGRTVLLHAEQGFGDAIQFVRYAPLVAARGGRVVVECRAALAGLFETAPGVGRVVRLGQLPYGIDVHAPLLSLARLFATRLETIPNDVPYLAAPVPRPLPDARAPLSVGFAWAGSPKHENDRNRSCRVTDFEPLADVAGVALYSLQTGRRAGDLDALPGGVAADLGGALENFDDTAAVIQGLDLVITVDTALAHLTGALGWPVWVVLPYAPDWRWLTDRDDSPWYPTMRLFRQGPDRDWAPVFARLKDALAHAVPS